MKYPNYVVHLTGGHAATVRLLFLFVAARYDDTLPTIVNQKYIFIQKKKKKKEIDRKRNRNFFQIERKDKVKSKENADMVFDSEIDGIIYG